MIDRSDGWCCGRHDCWALCCWSARWLPAEQIPTIPAGEGRRSPASPRSRVPTDQSGWVHRPYPWRLMTAYWPASSRCMHSAADRYLMARGSPSRRDCWSARPMLLPDHQASRLHGTRAAAMGSSPHRQTLSGSTRHETSFCCVPMLLCRRCKSNACVSAAPGQLSATCKESGLKCRRRASST